MEPRIADPKVVAEVERLSKAAADEATLKRLSRVLSQVGARLVVSAEDEAIFGMPGGMREEYPEYQFFVLGRMVEVRHLGMGSTWSLVDPPAEMLEQRQLVQEKFSTLIVNTSEGLGWFAPTPWDQLSKAQTVCAPTFAEDNLRFHLM
ncbi:MAG: hypothetical protein KKB08_04680 [Gammaproteobacteria bacterium]|nr:hypothetical protein [Gammaproteobacteria bacterium]